MYIERTTLQERTIIENAVNPIFERLDTARILMYDEIEEHFSSIEQKDFNRWEAEELGLRLRIVADIIFDSLLQYHLTVGHANWCGVAPYLESAERVQAAIKAEAADSKCIDLQHKAGHNTDKEKRIIEARGSAHQLPDNQAVVVLESIASTLF